MMLIRFNVSNFLSFDNEQEFSMISGKVTKFNERIVKDESMEILKFAALYGANASGKSNLIKAIDTAKKIVVNGIDSITENDLHFKLKSENKEKPTKFEFEFKINGAYYAFGFHVLLSSSVILGEWLYELTPSQDKLIYERDMQQRAFDNGKDFSSNENTIRYIIYSKDIMNMDQVLFLKEISRKNLNDPDFEVFNSIYDWFDEKLTVVYPDMPLSKGENVFNSRSGVEIVKLLEYLDTGITDFVYEESTMEEVKRFLSDKYYENLLDIMRDVSHQDQKQAQIAEEDRIFMRGEVLVQTKRHIFQINYENYKWTIHKLLFKHGDSDILFEFGEESDGTKRLIELLSIFDNDNNNKIIFIDELDRSFHPQMTRKFVETFFKLTTNQFTQLIITTHESNLLDLQLLRRDEIWFVERDSNNRSKLYSLENFKVRYDKKVDKDYLDGRYGAVPVFKNFNSFVGGKP